MENAAPIQSRIANLSDKHCMFQCGDVTFSVPATVVREVTMMPPVVPVPLSHPSLAGIGNVRSEFLPVIDLEPLIGDQAKLTAGVRQLLVIYSALGSWSIAIDRVLNIDAIETHIDADQRSENTTSVLIGTATYQGRVISVLDVNGLQRIAQQTLENSWNKTWNTQSPNVPSSSPEPGWSVV
jgi:chemotaxis signal transduction protein